MTQQEFVSLAQQTAIFVMELEFVLLAVNPYGL